MLLNLGYGIAAILVAPILIYRRIVHGKYKTGWGEKLFGNVPVRQSIGDCIWFHAVSVGEVLQLKTVVAELLSRRPDCEIVISTTTSTGHDVANRTFPDHTVCYFPLDFSWSVKNAIARIQPTAIALVELEVWPNFIRFARQANIPVGLINGRISANSYKGYRRLKFAIHKTFARLNFAAVQNQTYADRIADLGMSTDRITVTGSIKFDGLETTRDNPRTSELRSHFGIKPDAQVLIAGSTQSPEEQFAIDTYQSLKEAYPTLRLVLVPRHQERFQSVADLVVHNNLQLIRRTGNAAKDTLSGKPSQIPSGEQDPAANQQAMGSACQRPVLLLDTLGELSACWGLADIAFVGGSLTNRGGQNMIEPAAYGAAVLFGPNTRNFKDVVELLLDANAAQVVQTSDELTATVAKFLAHPQDAQQMGQRAANISQSQQGATARTIDCLINLLSKTDLKNVA